MCCSHQLLQIRPDPHLQKSPLLHLVLGRHRGKNVQVRKRDLHHWHRLGHALVQLHVRLQDLHHRPRHGRAQVQLHLHLRDLDHGRRQGHAQQHLLEQDVQLRLHLRNLHHGGHREDLQLRLHLRDQLLRSLWKVQHVLLYNYIIFSF